MMQLPKPQPVILPPQVEQVADHTPVASPINPSYNPLQEQLFTNHINIAHINIQSIRRKPTSRDLITHYIADRLKFPDTTISFFMISETWIHDAKTIHEWIKYSQIGQQYDVTTDYVDLIEDDPNFHLGKGTAIIIHKSWLPYLHHIHRLNGRVTALEFRRMDTHYIIGVVYLPPTSSNNDADYLETTAFVKTVLEKAHTRTKVILAGDWNIAPKAEDRSSTVHAPPTNTRRTTFFDTLTSRTAQIQLTDIWRLTHPESIEFTHSYTSNQTHQSQARIDYHLISPNLIEHVTTCDIDHESEWNSHHKLIHLSLELPNARFQHRFTPKNKDNLKIDQQRLTEVHIDTFNQNIINRQGFKKHLQILREATTSSNPISYSIFNSAARSFTNTLKSMAKKALPIKHVQVTRTNNHTSPANRQIRKDLREAYTFIATLQKKICNPFNSVSMDEDTRLRDIASYLELEHDNYGTTHHLCKSIMSKINRVQHTLKQKEIQEKVNKRTSHFYEFQKQYIKKLFSDSSPWEGPTFIKSPQSQQIITNPSDVKTGLKDFYLNLFSPPLSTEPLIPRLRDLAEWDANLAPLPFVRPEWYDNLLTPITETELTNTIKHLPKQSAPGPSGLTYAIFQLIKHRDIMEYMLLLLNHAIQTGTFPDHLNDGTIILLAKIPDWHGQLDKLRPITLLEALRKIFTKILTARLTLVLDTHQILKGHNFGFRRHKSTADSLSIVRDIIDDAKLSKKELYMASLDIQKAYDTVPSRAVETTLQRIRVPQRFINLIKHIDTHRKLSVSTPHGTSEPFTPTLGIPQGDSLSPILWAIFYDPLLCRLQNECQGYSLSADPNIRVAATAYADDLLPIADKPEQLQKMLDLTYTYLNKFNMTMNASKSTIVHNLPPQSAQAIINYQFNLNDHTIEDILPRNHLLRILGTWWSMDGSHTDTFSLAMKDLDHIISRLKIKFLPGNLTPHLINTVMIPKVAYRLQMIPLSQTQIDTIDRKFRSLTRSGNALPRSSADSFLYDSRMGVQLKQIYPIIAGTLLNNLVKKYHSSDEDLSKQVTVAAMKAAQKAAKLRADPTKAPIPKPKLKHLNTQLYSTALLAHHNLRLRNSTDLKPNFNTPLAHILSTDHYTAIHHLLTKYKIHTIQDIAYFQRNQLIPTKLMPFCQFTTGLKNTKHQRELQNLTQTPEFYRILQLAFAATSPTTAQLEDINFQPLIKPIFFPTTTLRVQPPLINRPAIHLWTDGSLKHNNMGAGVITTTPATQTHPETTITTESTRLSDAPGQESSTRPVLFAIYRGLIQLSADTIVTIFTDSTSAIRGITTISNPLLGVRKKLQTPNYAIIEAILTEMARFTVTPILQWVKGHNGSLFNEAADAAAKQGLTKQSPSDIDHTRLSPTQKQTPYLYQDGVRVEIYPSKLLSSQAQAKVQSTTNNRLTKRWRATFPNDIIDWNATLANINTLPRQNNLDNTHHREQRFRFLTFTRELQTLGQVAEYAHNKANTNFSPRCQRCLGEIETNDHLWACPVNRRMTPALTGHFNILLETTLLDHKRWHKLTKTSPPVDPILLGRMYTSACELPFMDTIEARGIITSNSKNTTKAALRLLTDNAKNSTLWNQYLAHCWLSAVYRTIWQHRNAETFHPNRPTAHFFTPPTRPDANPPLNPPSPPPSHQPPTPIPHNTTHTSIPRPSQVTPPSILFGIG